MNSLLSSGLSLLCNFSLTIVLFCASDVDILFRRSRFRLCSEQGVKYTWAYKLHTEKVFCENWCIQYETEVQCNIFVTAPLQRMYGMYGKM